MRSIFLFIFPCLIVSTINIYAQSITQSTFTATGQLLTNQGISLNFTVGELSIRHLKSPLVGINTGLFGKEEEGQLQTLPVRLVDFRLVVSHSIVNLHWMVSQEVGFAHYEVLKSTNGMDFASIGKVMATRNGITEKQYRLADNLFTGKSFYKLKMTDVDGKFRFSNTLMASPDESASNVSIYPNPVGGLANVTIAVEGVAAATLSIRNASGAVVWSKAYTLLSGRNVLSIPMATLPKGIYWLTVSGKDLNVSRQVVKL